MDQEQDWRDEVRANFRQLNENVRALETKTNELNTTLTMRGGGVLDRLSATESKAVEAHNQVTTIKAKVAFAAACISALVAAIWAVASKIWNPNN